MNIKRAKQEIKDAIEAYLLKDEYGDYVIPTVRQKDPQSGCCFAQICARQR